MKGKHHIFNKLSLTLQDSRRSSHAQSILFAVGAAVIAFLLVAYYASAWGNVARFKVAMDECFYSFCDFADYYYPMGEAIFRTGLPVKGFVYSPFIAILLAVFPPLGLNTALVLWGILQALCIVLYLLLFRKMMTIQ
jgi:hypothetical protein